jgi:hypothetical protein
MPRVPDGYDPVTKPFTWNSVDSGGGFQTITYTIEGTMVSFSGTQQVGGKQAKVRGTSVCAPDFKSNVQRIEVSVLNLARRLGGSSADEARSETADAADDEFGVFRSPAMITMLETVKRIAPLNIMILLTGESGTGKEVIANVIHRGAFTVAVESFRGVIRAAGRDAVSGRDRRPRAHDERRPIPGGPLPQAQRGPLPRPSRAIRHPEPRPESEVLRGARNSPTGDQR